MIGRKSQIIENKSANGAYGSLERKGKDVWQNEGMTQNVFDNKPDSAVPRKLGSWP